MAPAQDVMVWYSGCAFAAQPLAVLQDAGPASHHRNAAGPLYF
jgi:hypothetical protein